MMSPTRAMWRFPAARRYPEFGDRIFPRRRGLRESQPRSPGRPFRLLVGSLTPSARKTRFKAAHEVKIFLLVTQPHFLGSSPRRFFLPSGLARGDGALRECQRLLRR